ncbi:MAG: SAM-dependent methyltransferase [Cyanobacteria bacterium K_DeepCast_35m_m2_023]|nr:SAM-dependent methyltransferase [Cyanobacteria bacterium K_DeepCast_35m_m2_023]
MDWALHDPQHGAYGSGRLQVGPRGDFVTSPSLGPDFAALLAPQIAQWLQQLAAQDQGSLCLLEAGPGEGDLAADLARELLTGWPELARRLELVLIEPNDGMAARQRQRLADCPLPVRWTSFAALANAPTCGVLLAHEVLDALPVERVIWDGALWLRQMVVLDETAVAGPSLRLAPGEPLDPGGDAAQWSQLQQRGLLPPAQPLPQGWTTELHTAVAPWLAAAAAALPRGMLLVIDYALEAARYNAPARSAGTLMAYRGQLASSDPLQQPGTWDLTAHLCVDSVDAMAEASGWHPGGRCRQGQALLALGLAQRLHGLQQLGVAQLSEALSRREALLRMVDPAGLGAFYWLAYRQGIGVGVESDLFGAEPLVNGSPL